jgi:phenylpropionate dioxygenase-like ring-hydroxylating dioxygenase large terminal subunit
MIPKQWYVVMDSTQVRDRPVGVVRMGEKLVFWRDSAGKVICLRDKCAHRGVQLSKGKIISSHIQCPFHGLEYDSSGKVTIIPANGKNTPVPERFQVVSYPTHEVHNFIWIWWGENPPENLQPPQFRRVVVTQQPKASALQIGEQLFQADRPIIEYRRRRQELMEKARQ